jgi:hypothetical protein
MGNAFFNWIRGKGWWFAARRTGYALPPNATTKQIRAAIELLLDDEMASRVRPALHQGRERAAPLLEDAVHEPAFHEATHWPRHCAATALEMMLEVLHAHGSRTPLLEAERLVDAPEWQHRRVAARYLARSGCAKYSDDVVRLLLDEENLVRDQAVNELIETAKAGLVESSLATPAFAVARAWALREDKGPHPKAAALMLKLERSRAAADLTAPAALDLRLNWLPSNLKALRDENINVSNDVLRQLLDESLKRYEQEPDRTWVFHWSGIARECLVSLVHQRDENADQTLERLLSHRDESLRTEAAELQLKLIGFDPDKAVLKANEAHGFAGLTSAQQKYLSVLMLDAEVRNGGFLQYFSNPYAEHVNIALEALIEIGATASAQIVADAVKCFGAVGVPTDRDLRNTLLARLIPDDDSHPFDDQDARWYADEDHLRVRMQRFVLMNRDEVSR